jgi:hypothetical protein
MGLEKLLVGLYGTTPQIDLDQQIARVRVTKPTPLDFKTIGEGVIRNNMGLGGIAFDAAATIADGRLRLATGQEWPFRGAPPPGPGPHRMTYRVVEPLEPARTAVEIAD